MCSEEEFQAWKEGKLALNGETNKFISKKEAEERLEGTPEDEWVACDMYGSYEAWYDYVSERYEDFEEEHITPKGEKVIAFGYYGSDY